MVIANAEPAQPKTVVRRPSSVSVSQTLSTKQRLSLIRLQTLSCRRRCKSIQVFSMLPNANIHSHTVHTMPSSPRKQPPMPTPTTTTTTHDTRTENSSKIASASVHTRKAQYRETEVSSRFVAYRTAIRNSEFATIGRKNKFPKASPRKVCRCKRLSNSNKSRCAK